jgi:hypothetical protein
MKELLLTCITLLTLLSCQKDAQIMEAGNAEWYILTAPDANAIKGVYGDIDKFILITTGPRIYRTEDKGKTWKTTHDTSPGGTFSFAMLNDTLFVLDTQSTLTSASREQIIYAKNPSFFSLDQGLTWLPYINRKSLEDSPTVLLNKAYTVTGTEYKIDQVNIGDPDMTPGINTETGGKIALPKRHEINSIYFDTKNRLYVSASAALCGQGGRFSLCDGQNGVLYISKVAQR